MAGSGYRFTRKKQCRPKKYSDEEIEKMAKHFMEWADDPSHLVLREFSCEYKKSQYWLWGLADKYPRFAEALNYAETKIGARREATAGKEGGLNVTIARSTLATYDHMHRKRVIEIKRAEAFAKAESLTDALVAAREYIKQREEENGRRAKKEPGEPSPMLDL